MALCMNTHWGDEQLGNLQSQEQKLSEQHPTSLAASFPGRRLLEERVNCERWTAAWQLPPQQGGRREARFQELKDGKNNNRRLYSPPPIYPGFD